VSAQGFFHALKETPRFANANVLLILTFPPKETSGDVIAAGTQRCETRCARSLKTK
jgi:hypothetical protein